MTTDTSLTGDSGGIDGESPGARTARNFMELLQGLRVAVTGVQVLFAFLLTVPFAPGFARVAEAERWLFYVAIVGAALASMFFIAPVAQHRILFRQGLKETLEGDPTCTACSARSRSRCR